MNVYLDNSATTRCFDEVIDYMDMVNREIYGNPSSMHMVGVEAEKQLRYARSVFAGILKAEVREIYFTSGGTESDNLALIGCAMANRRSGMHLITTKVEHPAILETMKYLESQGFTISYLSTDENGVVSIEELKSLLTPETIIVSVMHTNNEIGALEPITEIGKAVKEYNPQILFMTDAVQGFGKSVICPKNQKIDLLSVSSHKIHGPKGVGLLYVRSGVKITPILFGGGQQKNLRSGTENVPGIAGFAKAAELMYEAQQKDTNYVIGSGFTKKMDALYELKKYFVDELQAIEGVSVNGVPDGDVTKSAPHIVSASFRGIRSEVLLHALENRGIYVSAGSACASNKPSVSATLKAIGLQKELLDSTIRFSFSVETTKEELEYTIECIKDEIQNLRRYIRY